MFIKWVVWVGSCWVNTSYLLNGLMSCAVHDTHQFKWVVSWWRVLTFLVKQVGWTHIRFTREWTRHVNTNCRPFHNLCELCSEHLGWIKPKNPISIMRVTVLVRKNLSYSLLWSFSFSLIDQDYAELKSPGGYSQPKPNLENPNSNYSQHAVVSTPSLQQLGSSSLNTTLTGEPQPHPPTTVKFV